MTTTIDTSYEKAFQAAEQYLIECNQAGRKPRIKAILPGAWYIVGSKTDKTKVYNVHLGSGFEMEGATCECQAANHPSCWHRGLAYIFAQSYLETPVAWECSEEQCYNEATEPGGLCISHQEDKWDCELEGMGVYAKAS